MIHFKKIIHSDWLKNECSFHVSLRIQPPSIAHRLQIRNSGRGEQGVMYVVRRLYSNATFM